MKFIKHLLSLFVLLFILVGCNSVDRFSILKKCTVLGDESIAYARAHYVKLFYQFNPDKFADSYKQVKGFDTVTHRNTIDTYSRAVNKISSDNQNIDDSTTQNLLSSCKQLSTFSKNFVENVYPKAISFDSKKNPLTDEFFIEINQYVAFDHTIGQFDKTVPSFKLIVEKYEKAVASYINNYRKTIPSEFVNSRK